MEASDHAAAEAFFHCAQQHRLSHHAHIPLEPGGVGADVHILTNDDEGSRLLARMGELHFFQSLRPHGQGQNLLHLFFFPGNVVSQRLFVDAGCCVACQVKQLQKFFSGKTHRWIESAITSIL